jgi:ABC-type glutathione transport system ATPase component
MPHDELMECLLQVRNLSVCYRRESSDFHQAVSGVNFDIERGEILGLMGESGCGKSTVALSLLGLVQRDFADISGSIIFQGRELLGMKEAQLRKIRGAEISLVYQEPEIALCPVMRVGLQIAEVVRAHRAWSSSRGRAEAESLLARVGFADASQIAGRYPHQLSGGQRQRVLLAQALACGPALIVADEPTASLDARSQADFLALLRHLKDETGTAMLLISHAPEIQAQLADRLLVMADGQIIEQGDVRQVCLHPSDPRTRKLLERNASRRVEAMPFFESPTEDQLIA